MEDFKRFDEITQMDDRHRLMGLLTGAPISLECIYKYLEQEKLHTNVPEEVKNQFNVLKNMALYTYFSYSLAPEVNFKTYTLFELSLRLKIKPEKRMMLRQLLNHAVTQQLISDKGFRHIKSPSKNNKWCKSLPKLLPDLRNPKAHGSTSLTGDCLTNISICVDFINQLFTEADSSNVD